MIGCLRSHRVSLTLCYNNRPSYCSVNRFTQKRILSSNRKGATLLQSTLSHFLEETRMLNLARNRTHNSRLAVHRLPQELISLILEFAFGGRDYDNFDFTMNYPTLSVCHLWRLYTISVPQLWNVVTIGGEGDLIQNTTCANLMAARSGCVPLELRFSVNADRIPDYTVVSRALEHLFPRIKRLFIQIWDGKSFEESFPLELNLPSLRTLVISYKNHELEIDCPYSERHLNYDLLSSSVPQILGYPALALESFSISSSRYGLYALSPVAISSLAGLRYLDIVKGCWDLHNLVEIIRTLLRLEVLAWDPYLPDEFTLSNIHLPQLKKMYVVHGAWSLLSHMEAPRLEALKIEHSYNDATEGLVMFQESLQTRTLFPRLKSLHLHDTSYMGLREELGIPGLTELTRSVSNEVVCRTLFRGLRIAQNLHTLLFPTITLFKHGSTDYQRTFVRPVLFINCLAWLINWRKSSSNRHPLHVLFGIARDEIPSLASFCDSVADDDSIQFTFLGSPRTHQTLFEEWWRSNTDS